MKNNQRRSLKISGRLSDKLSLLLHKLNLQAKCLFLQEKMLDLKRTVKVIAAVFDRPKNVIISQRIPQGVNIRTDQNGYRILEKVKSAVFVLADTQVEGHIFIKAVNFQEYSYWAIQRAGDIDRSWITSVEQIIYE